MIHKYEHSETFASLKKGCEAITGNLTSFQYLSTVDFFLRRGLDLLCASCLPFIENLAAKVTAHQTLKPATKFSRNTKGSLPPLLFNLVTTKDPKYFEDMNFNRGVLFGALALFGNIVNTYDRIHSKRVIVSAPQELSLKHRIQDALGMDYEYNLFAISREVQYWEAKAQWFKSLILQKYVRMALLQAQSVYKELAHSLSLNDIVQIYLVYVAKAIDRCDSRQGVLTTFITSWLKSARAEAARQAKENYHQSYDALLEDGTDLGEVLPNLEYEAVEHISAVAKQVDKVGVVRAVLGIPEFITSKQRAVLQFFKMEK